MNLNFFNDLNKNNSKPNIPLDDHNYLITLDKIASSSIKISNASKVSDYQNNSILFINDLINAFSKNSKIRFNLDLNNSKTNFNTFITITNKIIDKYFKIDIFDDNQYKLYIFAFYLYFLFFMNFRLGQFFLYYVFFEFKQISSSLSDTLEDLIKKYMNVSTYELNNLCKNNINYAKLFLPSANSKISFGKIQNPDYYFMDEFRPALNFNPLSKSSSKPTSIPNKFDTVIQLTNDAKKNADDKFDIAESEALDAKKDETDAKKDADNAKAQADAAKAQADAAKAQADAAKADYTIKLTTYNLPERPLRATVKLNRAKENVKNAFIATQKADIRIKRAVETLLITNINIQMKTQNIECKTLQLKNATERKDNLFKISNSVNDVAIDVKNAVADSNDGEYNNKLKELLPMNDKDPMNVQKIVQTMNRLSFEISKKYCEDALKIATERANILASSSPTITGGKIIKRKTKSIKNMRPNKQKYSIRRRFTPQ